VWPEVAQVAPAAGDGVLPPCLDDKMGENGEPRGLADLAEIR
jgi:hypothetical protein